MDPISGFIPTYYCLIRVRFDARNNIPDCGIALLPTKDISRINRWNIYDFFMVQHQSVCKIEVIRFNIADLGQDVEHPILGAILGLDVLTSPQGALVVLHKNDTPAFHDLAFRTRPLWDEYSMNYTADDVVKQKSLKISDFGTWAGQVAHRLREWVSPDDRKEFVWQPATSIQGLATTLNKVPLNFPSEDPPKRVSRCDATLTHASVDTDDGGEGSSVYPLGSYN